MSRSASTKIVELARIISESTTIVDDYFNSHGLPTPSLGVEGPSRIEFPPKEKEVALAHLRVLSATNELYKLMQGPTAMLMEISVSILHSPLVKQHENTNGIK